MQLLEFTPTEVDYIFRIFDSDNDGLISLSDFTSVVRPDPEKTVGGDKKSGFLHLVAEVRHHNF